MESDPSRSPAWACEVEGPLRGSALVPAGPFRPDLPLSSMVPSGPRSPRGPETPALPGEAPRSRAGYELQRLTACGAAPHPTSGALGAGLWVRRGVWVKPPRASFGGAGSRTAPPLGCSPNCCWLCAEGPPPPWSRTVRVARGGTRTPGLDGPGPAKWRMCFGLGGTCLVFRGVANVFIHLFSKYF